MPGDPRKEQHASPFFRSAAAAFTLCFTLPRRTRRSPAPFGLSPTDAAARILLRNTGVVCLVPARRHPPHRGPSCAPDLPCPNAPPTFSLLPVLTDTEDGGRFSVQGRSPGIWASNQKRIRRLVQLDHVQQVCARGIVGARQDLRINPLDEPMKVRARPSRHACAEAA